MDTWASRAITKKGLALQAKLIAGTKLTITRAVAGTGYVSPDTLQAQTAVTGEKQTLEFRHVTYPESGKCALPCRLTNTGLTAGYTAMQVGIYATDPDEGEILYAIAQAESGKGTDIPSESESPGYIAEWAFYIQFGQADSVEVAVSPSDTVTIVMLDNELNKKADVNLGNVDDEDFLEKARSANVATVEGMTEELAKKAAVDFANVENADFAKKAMEAQSGILTITTAGTGADYTAEIPGVTELYVGLTFNMVPHVSSTTTGPTLNVNGTGAVSLRQRLSTNTGSFTTGSIDTWLTEGKPISVTFDGTFWLVNHPRPSATYLYGTVPVEKGGTGATTAADALANLGAAPAYTYGTTKLIAGSSALADGTLHFVYE